MLEYEVLQDSEYHDRWLASAVDFDGEGEIFTVLFMGRNSEQRAKEYAEWKNASSAPRERAA